VLLYGVHLYLVECDVLLYMLQFGLQLSSAQKLLEETVFDSGLEVYRNDLRHAYLSLYFSDRLLDF